MTRPPGNCWHLLDPPVAGKWQADQTVSVVIPARNSQVKLDRALIALAAQTYPHEQLEIMVVDDGSNPPLQIRVDVGEVKIRMIRQDSDGRFGAGRARNRGARESKGTLLLFLDSDIVVAPDLIYRYARWLSISDEAVVTGILGFVDFTNFSTDQLRAEIGAGTLTSTLNALSAVNQQWREDHFKRSHDLTEDSDNLFSVVVGASLGVSRALFEEVHGFRELGVRGIEDIELGYRLHVAGGLLIADRLANQWHQSSQYFLSSRNRESAKKIREPFIERLIPVSGFRSYPATGVRQVPSLLVEIENGSQEEVDRTERSFAETEMRDVVFRTDKSSDDARFRNVESIDPIDLSGIPFRMSVKPGVILNELACGSILQSLRETGAGVVYFLDEDSTQIAVAYRQRAVASSLRRNGVSDLNDAGKNFGARWLPAKDCGISR